MFSILDTNTSQNHYFGMSSGILNQLPFNEIIKSIPEQHHLDGPFNLYFSTHHPDSSETALIIMQSSPIQNMYVTLNAKEMDIQSRMSTLHRHDFYELMFVIDGDIYQNIENPRHYYPQGSCCLMNKNVFHQEEYGGYHRIAFLQCSEEYLLQLMEAPRYFTKKENIKSNLFNDFLNINHKKNYFSDKNYIDFIPLETPMWIDQNIHDRFEKILWEIQSPSMGSTFRINAMMLELISLLFDNKHYHNTPLHFTSSAEQELFDSITRFLVQHNGRVSRKELETHFHYSGDYLYKITQKFTGLSLFDYGMKFCMQKACDLLITTAMPIADICQQLSFSNQTYFFKKFKEYHGMSPAKYRKLNRLQN